MGAKLSQEQQLEELTAQEAKLRASGSPPDPEKRMMRAGILVRLGRYDEAHNALDSAAAACTELGIPELARIMNIRADVLRLQGLYSEALASIQAAEQRSLADEHFFPGIYNTWANILADLGRPGQALKLIQRAGDYFAGEGIAFPPPLATNRGNMLKSLGRYHEALEAYDHARRLYEEQDKPVFPGIYSMIGLTLILQEKYAEALLPLDESERFCHEQGWAPWFGIDMYRGVCFGKLKRYGDAMAAYSRAQAILDEQRVIGEWELNFSRAITMYEAGHASEAIAEVYEAIALCAKLGVDQPAFMMETLQDWLSPQPEKLAAQQQASQPAPIEPVPDSEKRYDAFLSYRRDPGLPYSMLIKTHLDMNGRSIFRDQEDLHKGQFHEDIIDAIRHSRHMIVLMTPGFFERCSNPEDVLRNEISTALRCGTHIIPLMMEGFSWPQPADLPADIRDICKVNAMSYSSEFFSAFIDKLLRWMG
ncbi:TIR domain-containing protein [bacterium]|nr:TIR domain-containing protein [bacterium]UNM09458.1 MAG: TIR domain-containing protein [Planctomycetales bacterium]